MKMKFNRSSVKKNMRLREWANEFGDAIDETLKNEGREEKERFWEILLERAPPTLLGRYVNENGMYKLTQLDRAILEYLEEIDDEHGMALTKWEVDFVDSIFKQFKNRKNKTPPRLTDKQQNICRRIIQRVLNKKV